MCKLCLLWNAVNIEVTRVCRHDFGSVWEIDNIGLISGFKFFTVVPERKKCAVAPAFAIASLFVIFISYLEYADFIVLVIQVLMTVVFFIVIIVVACG